MYRSRQNRSQLVRLPSATGMNSAALELRSPDPSCKPISGHWPDSGRRADGIEKKMPLPAPVNRNLFHKNAAEGLAPARKSARSHHHCRTE